MHGLSDFNGLKARTIFCVWTGDELMSQNRLKALWSIFKNTACPIAFITKDTLPHWINPEHPLHPAYEYLSSTHKSDYLRCYLMHHYGGGYSDIKYTTSNWIPYFEQLELSADAMALGYSELAHGIPHLLGPEGTTIRAAHKELIGLCAFIFKPQSILSAIWYEKLHALLDQKLPLLQNHPGRFPLDQTGLQLPDGSISLYPLRWAEILGEILHPLLFRYKIQLIKAPIEPLFSEYR